MRLEPRSPSRREAARRMTGRKRATASNVTQSDCQMFMKIGAIVGIASRRVAEQLQNPASAGHLRIGGVETLRLLALGDQAARQREGGGQRFRLG